MAPTYRRRPFGRRPATQCRHEFAAAVRRARLPQRA